MKKSHNYYWLCYHVIICTKYRKPFIKGDFEGKLYAHMTAELEEKGCEVQAINGYRDQLHLLIYTYPSESLSDLISRLKGRTSKWVNKNVLTEERFSWQKGFKVFVTGRKEVRSLVRYIHRQKEHHQKISTSEEIRKWEEYYK